MSHDQTRERGLHELVRFVAPSILLQPVLTVSVSIIIARSLGPEGRGAYGVLVTTVGVLPLATSIGLEWAIRFWSARGEVDWRSLLKTASLIAVVIGLAAASLILLSWRLRYPDWLIPPTLGPLGAAALAVAIFLTLVKGFWMNFLAGQERYGYATWGTIAGLLLEVCVLAGVWWLSRVSLDAAVVALALQFVFSVAIFFPIARREISEAIGAALLPMEVVRKMLHYGWWLYLSNLLQQVEMRLNVFLLAALGDLYQTGLYTAVMGPANMLTLLSSPLGLVLLPRTARRSEDSTFPHRVAGALRLVVILTSLPAFALALLAPVLIPWVFGESFAPAVGPFWILLPGAVGFALVRVISPYLAGAEHPRWNGYIGGAGAALTVVLSALLIPRYGAAGAAIGTSAAYLGSALVAIAGFLRVSGLSLRELLAFRTSDWAPVAQVFGTSFAGKRKGTVP